MSRYPFFPHGANPFLDPHWPAARFRGVDCKLCPHFTAGRCMIDPRQPCPYGQQRQRQKEADTSGPVLH